ncbi:MAG: SO_0444 family Cu/Zn efflux transporter [Paludibacteraceae bacterium]|nr:SO_0444 family Cu/Zn efflux transporter [Paludibacteraceae bacterium]
MQQIIMLINEMAPYLLFGFLIAGCMHAFIPSTIYSRYLAQPKFKSVALATLFGIPLPLCSCGVIPTAMSLRREGASKGATTAFLIATPQTGVDSIVATYSLMGLPFAIIRPIAALVTALLGGQLASMIERTRTDEKETIKIVSECTNGNCSTADVKPNTFFGKLKEALHYAFVDMMQDIGKWLVVGLIVAGLITVFVPDSAFEVFRDNSVASILLVLCLAVPMYLCATGSIPIAVALMLKGLTPGAGLVLLMAGPACNMASILVINKVLGRKILITYLSSIITGAVGFGLMIDHVLPRQCFLSNLVVQDACCHDKNNWFSICCTIVFVTLLVNALIRYFIATRNSQSTILNSDNMKQIFIINGMNCNHCRTSAEKAILSVAGVTSASVDLATKVAIVEGTATPEVICKAVEEVGFSCTKA